MLGPYKQSLIMIYTDTSTKLFIKHLFKHFSDSFENKIVSTYEINSWIIYLPITPGYVYINPHMNESLKKNHK